LGGGLTDYCCEIPFAPANNEAAGIEEYKRAFVAGKIGRVCHSRSGKDPAAELGVAQSTIRLALKTASSAVQ